MKTPIMFCTRNEGRSERMKPAKHSFILCFAFLLGFVLMMSCISVTAYAESRISERSYVNSAGEDMGTKTCMHVNDEQTTWKENNGTDGWYAVTTTWYFKNAINVEGTVNLILCDSPTGTYTLIAKKGIILKPGSHLIIWSQSGGTGKIVAHGQENQAGIGGPAMSGDSISPETGDLTINGGNISASGCDRAPGLGSCGSNSGVITVNGGRVNANGGHKKDEGGNAPGIGAGDMPSSGNEVIRGTMNDIYLNGGDTTVYRAGNCPPIGDCQNSTGSIHINDKMKLEKAKLDENGRLTNYNLGWVSVYPKDNAGPAYIVNTSFDDEFGTLATSTSVAHQGEEIFLTANPKTNCHLVSIKVTDRDGEEITVTDGKFTMPDSSVTVNAKFKSDYSNVKVDPSDLGTITPDMTKARQGTTVTLSVEPEKGYDLDSLMVTDSGSKPVTITTVKEGEEYTFTMPDEDVTVSADYVALSQSLRASLQGSEYGSFKVSVNGGDPVTIQSDGGVDIDNVKAGDEITVDFFPDKDGDVYNGRVYVFYLEYNNHNEHHHEGDIENGSYTFNMPGDSTTIVVRFASYNETEEVEYIDENGDTQTVNAIVLTGNEPQDYSTPSTGIEYFTSLGREPDNPGSEDPAETWYVVKNNISYSYKGDGPFTRNIKLIGNVHIIVADGKTLSVHDEIVDGSYGSLSVYGQTKGTGKIVSESVKTPVEVCSGELNTGSINKSINVKNGKLTVNGNVSCSTMTISSGVTDIKGKASVEEELILGCVDGNDSITVGSYDSRKPDTAKIADGQTLVDSDGREYTGELSIDQLILMTGRTLRLTHNHDFSYSADGATITATCSADRCSLEDNKATLTIKAEDCTYDGSAHGASLADDEDLCGSAEIKYQKKTGENTWGEATKDVPVDAGTYKASITLTNVPLAGDGDDTGDVTVSVEYTINKAELTYVIAFQNGILTYTGEQQTPIVNAYALPVNGETVSFTYSKTQDGEYGDMPKVTNVSDGGTFYFKASAPNHEVATGSFTVTVNKADPTAAAPAATATYGQTLKDVELTNPEGNTAGTWTWMDNSTSVGNVGENTFPANFTPSDSANYNSKSNVDVTVTVGKAEVIIKAKDQSIKVGEKVPDLSEPVLNTHYTVEGLVGEDALMTDPKLAYASTPDNTKTGSYEIIASDASAGDNYEISYQKGTLSIKDKESQPTPATTKTSINGSGVSGIKAKTWTGKALKQSPVVKLSGKTLKNGTDYKVTYRNNKNVGKAILIIEGIGSYKGKITKTFKINPKRTSVVRVKKGKKAIRVKWKKQARKMSKARITGYQIQLATNKKFTKGRRIVNVKGYKKVSKKVRKLKRKRKYYVRVRTYKTIRGAKYYSTWSKVKTVKTR